MQEHEHLKNVQIIIWHERNLQILPLVVRILFKLNLGKVLYTNPLEWSFMTWMYVI